VTAPDRRTSKVRRRQRERSRRKLVGPFQGDCRTVMAQSVKADSVDLTVTSPPYDKLRTYGNSLEWNEDVWRGVIQELYRVTAPGGVVVWVVSDATVKGSETGTSFRQALYAMECGFNLHDTMIWDKCNFTAVGALVSRYAPVFDFMFIWSKGKPKTFNAIKDRPNKRAGETFSNSVRQADGAVKAGSGKGVKKIAAFGQRHNIWRIFPVKSKSKRLHPAQFPEALVYDHIVSYSQPGDLVLDPFMGAGTTGKVAHELGRKFIGIEKNPDYYAIACKRIRGD